MLPQTAGGHLPKADNGETVKTSYLDGVVNTKSVFRVKTDFTCFLNSSSGVPIRCGMNGKQMTDCFLAFS